MYVSPISSRFWFGRFTPAMRAKRSPYPCRCLWRGFVQMTMVLPCRLITRQRSHMGLTEARTFIGGASSVTVRDPSPRQVVGRELDLHFVAREDADVVLAHLSGNRGQDCLVHPIDLHPEHRARERLDDLAVDLDFLFFLSHLPHRNRAHRARLGTQKSTASRRGCQW